MPPSPEIDWIAFNLLEALPPLPRARALAHAPPGELAFRVPPREVARLAGVRDGAVPRAIASARHDLRRRAEREIASCRKLGIRIVTQDDPAFPAALREIADPPAVLYVRGELLTDRARVAVVGARRSTRYGERVADALAGGLARRGVEIVSGGARGIDTAAHRGALGCGGRSIAVLGSGLRAPYPRENGALFDRLAESGAVASELPLDTAPLPFHFPRRNRLISGLSAAIVVVEAAERSGSLSTASHALEQNREVLAVPGPVTSDVSAGCHRLIQQGAKLVHRIDDVVEELSPMYVAGLEPAAPPGSGEGESGVDRVELTDDERSVLGLLDPVEPLQLDDLADSAPFGIARLQAALFGLELVGLVEQLPGRYYLPGPRKER